MARSGTSGLRPQPPRRVLDLARQPGCQVSLADNLRSRGPVPSLDKVPSVNTDELVRLFNKNNDDLERGIEQGLDRLGPAAARRSRQVERLLVDPVMNRPHEGWPILDTLVEHVDDRPDGAMEYLGAYLVEDFVRAHGVEFQDLLEAAARDSPRWRRVLAEAYGWDDPDMIDPRVSDRLMPYIRLRRETESPPASTSGDIPAH
jgi:hypothetical protein